MSGRAAAGAIARFCYRGKFTSASRVSSGGGTHKTKKRATGRAAKTKCNLSMLLSRAGWTEGCISVHGWPVADSAAISSRTLALRRGRRALDRGCLMGQRIPMRQRCLP